MKRKKDKTTSVNSKDPKELRAKRKKLFREEYLSNGMNATEAYKKVYNVKDETAATNGWKLLRETKVRQKLDKRITDMMMKLEITSEAVLAQQAIIAFIDQRSLFDENGEFIGMQNLNIMQQVVVESVTVEDVWAGRGEEREVIGTKTKVKLYSRQKAIDNLMKYKGLIGVGDTNIHFGDKKEINLYTESKKLEEKLGADAVVELRKRIVAAEKEQAA